MLIWKIVYVDLGGTIVKATVGLAFKLNVSVLEARMQLIIIVILVSCDQCLSPKKSKKLGVNTCSRYFSLAKFELIKVLDKLIATETEMVDQADKTLGARINFLLGLVVTTVYFNHSCEYNIT